LTVLRYTERNALRANLVERAEDWLWSSVTKPRSGLPELHAGLVQRPKQWRKFVNEPQTELEVKRLREMVVGSRSEADNEFVNKPVNYDCAAAVNSH